MSSLKGFSVVGVSAEESKNPVLTVTAGGLHFNKEAVKLLGNPDYVRVLINENSSQAAIQVCGKEADGAIKFNKIMQEGVKRRGRKPKDPEAAARKAAEAGITAITIKTPAIMRVFGKIFELTEKTVSYIAKGMMLPDEKAIIYNLSDAEKKSIRPRGRKPRK